MCARVQKQTSKSNDATEVMYKKKKPAQKAERRTSKMARATAKWLHFLAYLFIQFFFGSSLCCFILFAIVYLIWVCFHKQVVTVKNLRNGTCARAHFGGHMHLSFKNQRTNFHIITKKNYIFMHCMHTPYKDSANNQEFFVSHYLHRLNNGGIRNGSFIRFTRCTVQLSFKRVAVCSSSPAPNIIVASLGISRSKRTRK